MTGTLEGMRAEAKGLDDETLAKELAFAEGFGETEGMPETHDWIVALRDETAQRAGLTPEQVAADVERYGHVAGWR